jgi:fimbrial chaperone protein
MRRCLLTALFIGVLITPVVAAGSLRLTPVTLALTAPRSAATLTLENSASRAINVQLRVFRWTQVDGEEHLEPTRAVVASPPIVRLAPGVQQTLRILRIDPHPVDGVETYRLWVDQLPDPADNRSGRVSFVVRQSVPVVFAAPTAAAPRVEWAASLSGGVVTLTAANAGDIPMKIAGAALERADGARTILAEGLLGYVLGGSTMRWTVAPTAGPPPKPGAAFLSLRTDTGIVHAPITVGAGR